MEPSLLFFIQCCGGFNRVENRQIGGDEGQADRTLMMSQHGGVSNSGSISYDKPWGDRGPVLFNLIG